ncbi:MAG: class II fructose-bisphosphate aldolase [Candidatus Andersenbacteria bacterium]
MIVRPHDLFAQAFNMQFAIGAFNTSNLEFTQAIIGAAQSQRSPVIVQTSEGALDYVNVTVMTALVGALANAADVPVILHLDHGKSLAQAQACIEAGFTSIMIDASTLPLPKNIEMTRAVVDYAHDRGVWVEAELGAILGAEGMQELHGASTPDSFLTDPKQAEQFVEETHVDALAISVGTIHGAFTGQEYVRFELLEEVQRILPSLPLVVHGASGIADDHLRRVATSNVCKINVDTELRIAWERALKTYFAEQHDKIDVRKMLGPARDAVAAVVAEKMKVFGSSGKLKVQ